MVFFYLVVIVFSFTILRYLLSYVVQDYLVSTQVEADRSVVEKVAVEIADSVGNADAERLYDYLQQATRDYGGRFLALDAQGIVLADGFSQFNGVQLPYEQTLEVLSGSNFAYGFYKLPALETRQPVFANRLVETLRILMMHDNLNEQWVLCSVSPMVQGANIIGCVVMSNSAQTLVDRVFRIEFQMTMLTIGIALVVVVIAMLLSGAIIRPVRRLTQGIQIIGQGNFSYRVPVKGHTELDDMARTFNSMSERLENLDSERSQFVGNASHELKTPLSSIKVLVETVLHQDPMDEDMTREFLGDINSEIDRMSALIGDLLALVKRDTTQTPREKEAVDLVSMTLRVASKLQPLAQLKDIDLDVQANGMAMVLRDPMGLEQMVTNLTDNAIKYTPEEGKVTLSVTVKGGQVLFSVKDNGIGIAPEHVAHIFDRFYRVDKARSRQTGGTGLGLSIVKAIVKQHEGTIEVFSQVDEGTEMRVTLPEMAL